jgi:superfamily I DNA and/or RNA helicase
MDTNIHLILIKNSKTKELEDKTAEVADIQCKEKQVAVTYLHSYKTYNYNSSNIVVLKNPSTIDISKRILIVDGFPIRNPSSVLDFGEYIKIIDQNGNGEAYHKSKVSYEDSCLNEKQPKAVFDYFKKLSPYISVMEDGRTVLFDQYEKIEKISENSVLSTYLSGSPIKRRDSGSAPIFPFGTNISQKKAVIAALENSISIIEGPPGTGKTQTILNIIANIIANGKTVGIAAGNNSATSNVQEKLERDGYEFITALLGNSVNKDEFFKYKQVDVPDIDNWYLEVEKEEELSEELISVSKVLDELLEDQNSIAKLKEELSKLKIEQKYFEENFKDAYIPIYNVSFYKNWSKNFLLELLSYLENKVETGQNKGVTFKAGLFFKYGIYKFRFFHRKIDNIISSVYSEYYKVAINEKEQQIETLEKKLMNKSYKELMDKYKDISKELFNNSLYKRYSKRSRGNYTIKSYKYNFKSFIEEYPVLLSTTHSIMNSITENYLFDYIIIDEASQVDLVTASLALACCKNVVIVGDIKQLPQIVSKDIEKISNEMFYSDNLKEVYNYSKFSIIASLMKLYGEELPKTLLSEHYRCHPKIIGFCNEKFYNNELVIMTEEKPEDKPLMIYKTAPGNHARKDKLDYEKGWYNIRQIEVIRDEIIGQKDENKIGIICPYRKQVKETNRIINSSKVEIDTVHKFQGREKSTIIFSTVANDINPFIDDANLINVAVSRAVNEFIVVTSNKLFKQHGSNLGDLFRYIEYNSLSSSVIESNKISVFDLLYSEYSDKLLKYMTSKKYISTYESENLMYKVTEEVLELPKYSSFKCVIHIPLKSIVKDFSKLKEDERKFAANPWTHVDFLIFNKLDKEPVLAIEVDGHGFHKNNEKQLGRDKLKDKILEQVQLPLLRISTNESGEKERLLSMLDRVIEASVLSEESAEEVLQRGGKYVYVR